MRHSLGWSSFRLGERILKAAVEYLKLKKWKIQLLF
jgi:hypothetical protein